MRSLRGLYQVGESLAVAVLLILVTAGIVNAGNKQPGPPVSQFLAEVNKKSYPDVAHAVASPVLKWDFSRKRTFAYAYEQQVRASTSTDITSNDSLGAIQQSISGEGRLLVKSQGDGTADLVLQDMTATMRVNLGKGKEPQEMKQAMPPVVMQGLHEDGSSAYGDDSQEALLKMLFPLPKKDLRVGESVDMPARMPFNAMGSILYVHGKSRITLTRYVKIGKKVCAQFNVETDISDLKVPAELEGDYRFLANGTSVYYFDVDGRVFVSGTTAFLMQMSVNAPTPKVSMPEKGPVALPDRFAMSMLSDNLIRVSLQE